MLAIFNSLGGGEVIAILVIGLIVLGPEKLPDAIRKFGNIYGEFRRMSQGFQSELRDAFDEPLQSLRGTAQMMQDSVNQPLQAITDMTAPVVGGAATAEPVEVTATDGAATETAEPVEVTATEAAATETADGAPVADATVDEVQAPVDDDEAPAGSAAETWAAEQTYGAERSNGAERANGAEHPNGAATPPSASATPAVEAEAEPDVREDEEPVLAEAGLLLSEPEMPTESSEDEERPG